MTNPEVQKDSFCMLKYNLWNAAPDKGGPIMEPGPLKIAITVFSFTHPRFSNFLIFLKAFCVCPQSLYNCFCKRSWRFHFKPLLATVRRRSSYIESDVTCRLLLYHHRIRTIFIWSALFSIKLDTKPIFGMVAMLKCRTNEVQS